ncbi:MAG: squalene synthase HpnC [Chloroflexi bacterium]|nr:squalene synthase HpnC [Chloroflexota bacterium]|tara:strand:+ start:36927 stop:37781 length:855 start_codon:yes stop_codon:yes gene_type:complete
MPNIQESYTYCENLVKSHYENFTIGSLFLPKHIKNHLYAIYSFCRNTDDIGDSLFENKIEKLNNLDILEAELHKCYKKGYMPKDPFMIALQDTINKFNINITPFLKLIEANRIDQTKFRYNNFKELENYCSKSANPVGHLVLNIFGYSDDLRKTLSDYTCTALQLTNFLQGIQNDYNLGRIYIPNEDMENFNCKEKDILNSNSNPNFIKLVRFQTNRAYDLFKKGEDLFPLITRRFRTDIKLFSIGGIKILDKIKSQGYDIINNPPKLNMKDKLEIIFKSIINK